MDPGIDLPGFLFYFGPNLYPMQTTKALLLGAIIMCRVLSATAQSEVNPDSTEATKHALIYADSLVNCNFYQNWPQYMALTCPSAIKYYGGKDAFKEHIVMIYFRNEPKVLEKPERLRILNMYNDTEEWQCVIEKVRDTWIDDRKAKIISYLVGRSEDNGDTWKFVDVSHNSLPNLGYILPEIFSSIAIPVSKTTFGDEAMADKNK